MTHPKQPDPVPPHTVSGPMTRDDGTGQHDQQQMSRDLSDTDFDIGAGDPAGFDTGAEDPAGFDTGAEDPVGDDATVAGDASKPQATSLPAGLYVVATPIGNMGDITRRACQVLGAASVVACEDTRVTGAMLRRLGISTPMLPYHEHNAERMRPQVLSRIAAGEAVALVSDAGTPLVSDPGFKLVREARDQGLTVVPVPGASALLTALMVAGLPTDRFLFAGFPPSKEKARQEFLSSLKAVPATLVVYESVHRLPESLASMAAVFGPREAAVCRELTKLHEEVRRAPLTDLAAHYAAAGSPKGEAVVVIAPPEVVEETAETLDLDGLLRAALARLSVRDATAEVVSVTGLKKRDVYNRALELAAERDA